MATSTSVYTLYSVIYHSEELNSLMASKAHPTETLRQYLLGVTNGVLFWAQPSPASPSSPSAALVGQPGATPGPVEMKDPGNTNEPSAS